MSTREADFLKSLRATFKVEAAEHLHAIATGLLELEKAPVRDVQAGIIETVFRAAHSLKGAARAVDFTEIESHCQQLEDVFASWKRKKSAPTAASLDALHRKLDSISAVLSASEPAAGAPAPPVAPAPRADTPAPTEFAGQTARGPERRAVAADGTVRISVAKLDASLVKAEEMLTAKQATGQRAAELRELLQRFEAWTREWSAIEPDAHALRQEIEQAAPGRSVAASGDAVARLLDFTDWNVSHLRSMESKLVALTRSAEQNYHVIGKLVDDLLEDSKNLLLLPFATLSAQFPKLVRDLCRDQSKEADLVIEGEDVELDKRILEDMKDPLVHLLRNCVDHGVEKPDVREAEGKSRRATITVAATQVDGSKVEISVADDGKGVDVEHVRQSAVKHGLLSPEAAARASDAEARGLIFQAEVSTSPMITRVSGRGLGLAIVRERAEELGGTVSVESQPGRGTTFRIVLPSLLATFRGILVEAAGRQFVVPTAHVERVARVRADDVRTVEGRDTISLSGRAVARVSLSDVLQLPGAGGNGESPGGVPVVVLGMGDQRIAFAVDAVLDEQEVLVKTIGRPLSRVRNIAGATVLGSGQVVPILNVADLLKSARGAAASASRAAAEPQAAEAGSILVAEDSITSRMLLKSILESAGYRVKTAVDGMEAFALLRAEHFDLIVSDVEMPRLNGFDLTARIRADKKLAELPVVLVTALETREDRERGVDVGASAYIIKSNFDQSNLLDAIRRLI